MAYMTKKQRRWRFVIPIIIIICLAFVVIHKLGITEPYTVKLTVYDQTDRVYVITSECVTTKLGQHKDKALKSAADLFGIDSDIKDIEIVSGCGDEGAVKQDDGE